MDAVTLLTVTLSITANGLAGFLIWWFNRVNKKIEYLEKELNAIRLNYLDRFEDLKDHISRGNLEIIQRISTLEGQKRRTR